VTLTWTIGKPCSCSYAGNFLKISKHVDIVVIIKVTDYKDYFVLTGASPNDINQPQSATFEIVEILKGQENRKEIKVFGDNGFLCRPYINKFQKGKYYIVGLYKCQNIERENGIKETVDDYQISSCGDYWVDYSPDNKTVKGFINKKKKPTIMTLEKIKSVIAGD
jgi:hypothetical protein